jgi:hypothetical protein
MAALVIVIQWRRDLGYGRRSNLTARISRAVSVLAIYEAVAVVIHTIVTDLHQRLLITNRVGRAVLVSAVCEAVAVVVHSVVADFCRHR